MFSSNFLALASAITAVTAHPVTRAAAVDDTTVLNFALTLEHLENAFYAGALAKFTEDEFTGAGLPSWARERFEMIGQHEQAHVAFLSDALGANATQPCNYTFPYTDPPSFAALSAVLENVGVSAYAGAAELITNKDYLTAAAVVLSTEARHQAWVSSAVNKDAPWGGALDTPLDLDAIYSLAAPFIVSCPSSNPALPVTAYPAVTISPPNPHPGDSGAITLPSSVGSGPFNATFYYGLAITSVALDDSRNVTIPADAVGTVYYTVSNSSAVVAGPGIIDLTTNSAGAFIH